jgi:hypothetical protein
MIRRFITHRPEQLFGSSSSWPRRFGFVSLGEAMDRTNPFKSPTFVDLKTKLGPFRFFFEHSYFLASYQLYVQLGSTIVIYRLLSSQKITMQQLQGWLEYIRDFSPLLGNAYTFFGAGGWFDLRATCEWTEPLALPEDATKDLPSAFRERIDGVCSRIPLENLTMLSAANTASVLTLPFQVVLAFVTAPVAYRLYLVSPIHRFIKAFRRGKASAPTGAGLAAPGNAQPPVPRPRSFTGSNNNAGTSGNAKGSEPGTRKDPAGGLKKPAIRRYSL